MSVVIRRATLEDAAEIAAVHVRSWRAAYVGVVPQGVLDALSPEDRADEWRGVLGPSVRERDTTLVAERDDQIVGFASGGAARDAGLEGLAEVYAVYLEPARWGRGLGRRLLDELIDELADLGFSEAALWVFEGNTRGRAFYEAQGWRPDGAHDPVELCGAEVPGLRYRRRIP